MRIVAIVYERWWTADLPTSCNRCRGLNGTVWRAGEGPRPPLHFNCHCERRYERTEFVEIEVPGE